MVLDLKKFLVCLFSILMLFSFASCKGEETSIQETQSADVLTQRTADEWIDFIAENVPFDDTMTKVGAEQAMALYGIFEEDGYNGDCALYISTMATPEEIAVFKADDNLSVDDLLEKIQSRLQKQTESYSDYAPQEVPKLSSAVVKTVGDTVIVAVTADNALAEDIIK